MPLRDAMTLHYMTGTRTGRGARVILPLAFERQVYAFLSQDYRMFSGYVPHLLAPPRQLSKDLALTKSTTK